MTPASPTWADIEAFLVADEWRKLLGGERGGSSSDHVFYEKLAPDGRLLQTHVSHSSKKTVSAGRFGSILREQLEVSRQDFWRCIQTGKPVERPVPVDDRATVRHPAWVINVLVRDLRIGAAEIETLSAAEAERLVYEHWAKQSDG